LPLIIDYFWKIWQFELLNITRLIQSRFLPNGYILATRSPRARAGFDEIRADTRGKISDKSSLVSPERCDTIISSRILLPSGPLPALRSPCRFG